MKTTERDLPTVAQCKAYMAGCGWTFSHRDILRRYVFTNPNCAATQELAWGLRELRDAYRYGW